MSTERNAMLVIGWETSNSFSLTTLLKPIAEHFDIEHDSDDLPAILSDEYSSTFMKHMPKHLRTFCSDREIEIVYGSNGYESGAYYFGMGVPYISDIPVHEFLKLIEELNQVMAKSVDGIDVTPATVQNVISWF